MCINKKKKKRKEKTWLLRSKGCSNLPTHVQYFLHRLPLKISLCLDWPVCRFRIFAKFKRRVLRLQYVRFSGKNIGYELVSMQRFGWRSAQSMCVCLKCVAQLLWFVWLICCFVLLLFDVLIYCFCLFQVFSDIFSRTRVRMLFRRTSPLYYSVIPLTDFFWDLTSLFLLENPRTLRRGCHIRYLTITKKDYKKRSNN